MDSHGSADDGRDRLPAVRSPAQVEASRRNGALSRGPRTAAGKAISARNSLKHGIFAKKLMPPGDSREHDRLYDHARAELAKQFDPQTFTDYATIDALAADYVQRARIYQMIEVLQRPPGITLDDVARWHRMHEVRAEIDLLDRAIAELPDGEFACEVEEAELLGQAVSKFVDRTLGEAAQAGIRGGRTQPPAEDPAEDPDDDLDVPIFDDWEIEELEGQLRMIGRFRRRFADASCVMSVLTGGARPKKGELDRLRDILRHIRETRQQFLALERDVEDRLRRAERRAVAEAAWSPEPLMLLHRYQREIEREIERKIDSLTR